MDIDSKSVGDSIVLTCHGKITLGQASRTLRQAVRAAAEESPRKIILNLGGVAYIDSAGIGELVSAFTHTWNRGSRLVLVDLTREIHELLVMTKLIKAFEIFDSETAGLRG